MEVTIQMDAMGSIHVWDGLACDDYGYPVRTAKYLWEFQGREADYYLQFQSDIERLQEIVEYYDRRGIGDRRNTWDWIDRGWPESIGVNQDNYEWLQRFKGE